MRFIKFHHWHLQVPANRVFISNWFWDLAVTSASKDLAWTIHSLAEVAGNAACRAMLQLSFPNHLARQKQQPWGYMNCARPSLNQFSKTLLLALKRGCGAVSLLWAFCYLCTFKAVTTPHCIEDEVKTLCDGQNIESLTSTVYSKCCGIWAWIKLWSSLWLTHWCLYDSSHAFLGLIWIHT